MQHLAVIFGAFLLIASRCGASPEEVFPPSAKVAPFEKGADGKLHCAPGYSPMTICPIDSKDQQIVWCAAGF
jgi:hypothetical protein